MHEFSLIQALLRRVETEAQATNAIAVHRLSVCIGQVAGVERHLFASAYDLCRRGTICEKAELDIDYVQAKWACRVCGRDVAQGEVLSCPDCGAPARLVTGDEIVLKQIEMEIA
ncbi:MAG: hydrogenase maturation nickel metallochaperone HypA [Pyrinomonadaceae bacterium]|nr:hydrogenase maturation nickel metallochaperone HypA [Pyrinomonadaceae bacterium]